MKKIITFALLCVLCPFALMAQTEGYMKETFNSEDFPEVSFVWHDNGADLLQTKDVRYLKENGISKPFTLQPLQRDARKQANTSSSYGKTLWKSARVRISGQVSTSLSKALSDGFYQVANWVPTTKSLWPTSIAASIPLR